jgi:hypothetical protein
MKRLYNTLTQKFLPTYPRADDEPIVGLDPSLEIYEVIETAQPEITGNQYLTRTETADHTAKTLTLGWQINERPVEPPPPVIVTFRALAFALLEAGLYEQVKAAALSTPQGEIWWSTAQSTTVQRDHPFVVALATAVGQTPEQIDAIFAAAASTQF